MSKKEARNIFDTRENIPGNPWANLRKQEIALDVLNRGDVKGPNAICGVCSYSSSSGNCVQLDIPATRRHCLHYKLDEEDPELEQRVFTIIDGESFISEPLTE